MKMMQNLTWTSNHSIDDDDGGGGGKKKVNVTHSMPILTHWGRGGIAPLFLNPQH
jgi:hypothetical protein